MRVRICGEIPFLIGEGSNRAGRVEDRGHRQGCGYSHVLQVEALFFFLF